MGKRGNRGNMTSGVNPQGYRQNNGKLKEAKSELENRAKKSNTKI